MRVAITGAGGQLGTELGYQLGGDAILLSHAALDITNRDAVLRYLANVRPDVVINAAAYTNVDGAEDNKALCRKINVSAVSYLAEACGIVDCPLVHLSSDYVFGGESTRSTPYREVDETAPQGVYAHSKRDGELKAQQARKHFIVRTCGVYGLHDGLSGMKNFVNTMLRLGADLPEVRVVDDQVCGPTFVQELAAAISFLISTNQYGTYHIVNSGEPTWYQFASEIYRIAGLKTKVTPITTKEFGAKAARPTYSVLDTAKYHALQGPAMSDWQDALVEAMRRRPATHLNASHQPTASAHAAS